MNLCPPNADFEGEEVGMSTPPEPAGRIVSQYASDPEMAELIELFVSELPQRIEALNSAWNESRMTEVTRIAHQLRGACSGYGFPSLGKAAGALEDGLRTGAADGASSLAGEFKALVDLCARACGRS
jgi:histidine phosphotransfer protein HptB